jgi:hypothetical protein
MGGNFMPALRDISDDFRMLLRHAPEHEKGRRNTMCVQLIEDAIGIGDNPRFESVPVFPLNRAAKRLDLVEILYVYGKCIFESHGLSRYPGYAPLRATGGSLSGCMVTQYETYHK